MAIRIHRSRRGRPGARVHSVGPRVVERAVRPVVARPSPPIARQDGEPTRAPAAGPLHPLLPDTEDYAVPISIIIPTRGRPQLLRAAVESCHVAAQAAEIDYEIIVVDGGSPAADDVRPWTLKQPHCVYLTDPQNTGAVAAVNHGFSRARGRYVACLNDDATLEPHALRDALARMTDPIVGQVAFEFFENGEWKLEHCAGAGLRHYANFGMIRTHVGRAVVQIGGGLWPAHYATYGADVELSCLVTRLGYEIAVVRRGVRHSYCCDDLRQANEANDTARHDVHRRWTEPEQTRFRGPMPRLSAPEIEALRRIEVGEDRSSRIARIPLADPEPGKLPPTAPLRPERVVASTIITADDPQASLGAALRKLGTAGYQHVDWLAIGAPEARARAIVEVCREWQPTLVFLQVQGAANMPLDVGRRIREVVDDPGLVLVTWNGDVIPAQDIFPGLCAKPWEMELSQHVDLMLFSGVGQVEIMRQRGMVNAAYLQIGHDVDRYYAESTAPRTEDVVFLGQNYVDDLRVMPGQGVHERRELVRHFLDSGLRFRGYGPGWADPRIKPLPQAQAGDVLRRAKIAVVVSATSALARYSSDRLFRAAACGAVPLVRRFDDIEGLGFVDGDTCIVFDTPAEAVELAREWLGRPAELDAIGRRAAELARTRHTWAHRMTELSAILHSMRGIR